MLTILSQIVSKELLLLVLILTNLNKIKDILILPFESQNYFEPV